MQAINLNKQFEFIMPLQKGYTTDDGYYHIEFAISSGNPDLQGDQMTDNALNKMALQAKGLNVDGSKLEGINIDDNHFKGLHSLIGPVTDAWVDTKKVLWVNLKVRKEWETTIKDLVDSGTRLGGSIQGAATEILTDDGSGIQKINDVFLTKAALTDTPAAWDTRGTAQSVSKICFGSMCSQIMKSLDYELKGGDMIKKSVISVDDAFETIQAEINEALDDKYGTKTDWGVSRDCYIAYTTPDFVIISTYDCDMFQIPYIEQIMEKETLMLHLQILYLQTYN